MFIKYYFLSHIFVQTNNFLMLIISKFYFTCQAVKLSFRERVKLKMYLYCIYDNTFIVSLYLIVPLKYIFIIFLNLILYHKEMKVNSNKYHLNNY